ncbi:hypothetical protein [Maribacter sp. 2307UL18-2]|uniref:hypothetical protein n=1 Tax=Maribacter sp. 2307UL18-2 TaxID=3386274 RepID=UPI0039BCD9DE
MIKYISILFFTSVLFIQAQSNLNVEKTQLQFGLPLPSILYEVGTSKNMTLSLEAIAGFELRGCTDCETNFGIYPILRGQYRYYYNMGRRLRKKKNISGNSGNYVAALIGYQHGSPLIGDLNTTNTLGVGPVYGLQRTYRKGFFYRLEGGVAYFQDDFEEGIGLVLAARIGWVIGKK